MRASNRLSMATTTPSCAAFTSKLSGASAGALWSNTLWPWAAMIACILASARPESRMSRAMA
ncbi:hypothetical protein D3C78_1975180 [compost metagenome]